MIDLSTNLLPALSSEEEARLRASIKEQGFDPAYPVVVDEDGAVLDGWHRKRIAEELGIEPVIVVKAGLSHWEKVKVAVGRNIDRRQLDRWQTGRLAQKLLPEAAAAAAARRTEGAEKGGKATTRSGSVDPDLAARKAAGAALDTQFNPPANDATIARHREAGRAKEEVGSLLGVSRRTVDRAVRAIERFEEEVEAAGIPEEKAAPVISALDQGHISLLKARQALGLAPPPPGATQPEPAGPAAKAELMATFVNTVRALAVGFDADDGRYLRSMADDLLIPLRTIERHYCGARKP